MVKFLGIKMHGPPLKKLSRIKVQKITRCLAQGESLVVLSKRIHIGFIVIKRNIVENFGEAFYQKLVTQHHGLFKKGNQPWNTGLKGFGSWLTEYQFKKGHLRYKAARTWKPVGTKAIWSKKLKSLCSGLRKTKSVKIRYIKYTDDVNIRSSKRWKAYARYVWEQNYGPIPDGMCVVHLDMNCLNDDLENLEMMTRAQYFAYLNSRFPQHDIQKRKRLSAALKGKVKVKRTSSGFWDCSACGYRSQEKLGQCPKCNGFSLEKIIVRQKVAI